MVEEKIMKITRFPGDKILCFVLAVLAIAVGVVLLPSVTQWGAVMLNWVIAAGLVAYSFAYLLGVARRSGGRIKLLTIIEMVVMLLIAVGLILAQFKIFAISEVCQIVGLALALRGIVCMFKAYYYQFDSKAKYPLLSFVVNVVILVLGVYIFAKPFVSNSQLVIALAVICFIIALILIIYAITLISADNKGKSKSTKGKKTSKSK